MTIEYTHDGEWSGYSLERRVDGLWRYEGWSRVQGQISGRVALIEEPAGLAIKDEADLDTLETPCASKAEILLMRGQEVRCLRRGYRVS